LVGASITYELWYVSGDGGFLLILLFFDK